MWQAQGLARGHALVWSKKGWAGGRVGGGRWRLEVGALARHQAPMRFAALALDATLNAHSACARIGLIMGVGLVTSSSCAGTTDARLKTGVVPLAHVLELDIGLKMRVGWGGGSC